MIDDFLIAGFILGFAFTFGAAILAINLKKKRKALPPHDPDLD